MRTYSTLLVFLLLSGVLKSQDTGDFYYKDTAFGFHGFRVSFTNSLANDQVFRTTVTIVNTTTDQYLFVDPEQVTAAAPAGSEPIAAAFTTKVIVPPSTTKKFAARFKTVVNDLRQPTVEINFKTLKLTAQAPTVYELSDVDLYNETTRQVGPVTWRLTKFSEAPNERDDRILNTKVWGTIEYTGTNFFVIRDNGVSLTTLSGFKYMNIGKLNSKFSSHQSTLYYKNGRENGQKLVFEFPVEPRMIGSQAAPRLHFNNALIEYTVETIGGFKVILKQGTAADFDKTAKEEKEEEPENGKQ